MEDELVELMSAENPPSMYAISKKFHNTIAKTYSIPMEVYEKFEYYSMILGIKKSHLASACCLLYEREDHEKLSQEIHDLMWGDESCNLEFSSSVTN